MVRGKGKVERARLGLLCAAAALWGAAGQAASPVSGSLQPLRVALAAPDSLYHLPLIVADQLGYWRRLGLRLEWLAMPSGAQALAALQAGQVDVLSGAFEHALLSAAQGPAVQAFFMFSRTPQISLGISSRLQGPLGEGLLNVRERRIGITAADSGTHWVASQWVRQAGLPAQQAQFVNVGAGVAAVEALRSGQVDLLCNPDPQIIGLEQRGELLLLAETRSLSGTRKLFGGLVPGACLHSRLDVLTRQPSMLQTLCDGLAQALRWLQTAAPSDILRTVPMASWMGDRTVYLGAFERLRETFVTDGRIDEQAAALAWSQLLQGRGQGQQPLPAARERPFTNEFALRVRSRPAA